MIMSFSEFLVENDIIKEFENHIREKYKDYLHSFYIYLSNNNNIKLDMLAVNKDSQKQGIGSKIMEELCGFADKNKMNIILYTATKDDNFGTTSRSRLISFYKKFGFVENKGRKKDYSIRENMYRKYKD